MGDCFRGFFTTWHPDVGEAAVRRGPFCSWKRIDKPLVGVGVRCPDPDREAHDDAHDDAHYEELLQMVYGVEDTFPEFTKQFPELTFAFIVADCFGGVRSYYGSVVKYGSILREAGLGSTGAGALE
jgi:hypothetical protein